MIFKRRVRLGVGAITIMMLCLVCASFSSPVFAAGGDKGSITKKAALYGVYKTCYKGNQMITPIRSDEFRNGVWGLAKDDGSFTLPTGWYNEFSVNCLQLIQNTYQGADFKGVTSLTGVTIPSDSAGTDAVNSFLSGMGYTKTAAAGGKCATYSYVHDNGGDPATATMCANVDSQGRITSDQVTVSYSEGDGGYMTGQFELDTPGEVDLDCNTNGPTMGGCETHEFTKGSTLFTDLAGEIYEDLQDNRSSAICDPTTLFKKCWRLQPGVAYTDQSDAKASFKIDNSETAGAKAIKYLSKNSYSNLNAIKLSEKERITLLQDYLKNYYKVSIYGCNLKGDDAKTAKSSGHFKVKTSLKSESGDFQECWVKPTKNGNNNVAGFNSSFFFDGTMMNFETVVEKLNEAAKNQKKDDKEVKPSDGGIIDGDPDGGDDDEPQETPCQQAAGSLSWIICPVMTTLNNAVEGIYTNLIEPILQVNSTAFKAGENDGVYLAWKEFRNYANIGFAIALALVILSQLTGIGLSNYNIKRILPRLIMVIVLVNISFILCQLAVDLSNVLGSALKDLLSGIAENINDKTNFVADVKTGFLGGDVLRTIMDAFLNAGVIAAIGLTVTGTALSWDLWLVPLILILFSFLLSVLFFFIILAVRQAGVFVLVALAPVAIICYALPNTKSLFDKWYKLFTALLIVYPICGLLMGGGQLATAIILNASIYTGENQFFMMLIAIIVSVAPFFLIPSVIKNSMGALGNIGAKLSNFGSKAGGFLGGVFMGSRFGDRVKRRADERTANRDEARAYRAQGRQLIRDTKALNRLRNREAAGEILSLDERELAGRLSNRVLAAEKSRNANRLRGGQMLDAGGVGELIKRQNRGQTDELEKAEVANTLAQYQHGEINGVDFSQLNAYDSYDVNGAGIGSLNSNSLEAEYGRQLDALSRNPEDAEALRKVKALQQHFATQGDSGRAVMQRAFESRLASGNIAGLSKATQAIASDSRTLGDIKGADRGLFAMVNDINSGRARTGAGAAAYYGSRGTDKYNAQSLVNADEGALNRLVARTNDGTITGGDLNSLAGSAREALSNPNINVKPEQEAALRQLANAGYAQGASSSATSGTAGSNAMAASSAANINSAASYIRGMNGGSRFSSSANAANNADYKMIQGMAQNAQTALQDSTKTYDQDQVKAMQDVIKAARDMGVSNDVGNTFDNVNPTRIQIRGVEARSMPTPPAGFSPDGVWIGGGSGPNPAQQAAVDQYLRERASTERYNRQHGFGPGSGGTP